MRRILCIMMAIVALCESANAQFFDWGARTTTPQPGTIRQRISSDAAEAINSVKQQQKRETIRGYTILLYSDIGQLARENAFAAKAHFEHNFPATKVIIFYESPSFYVTAGSYITMEEAVIELNRFRSIFPKAIVQSKEHPLTEFINVEGVNPEAQDSTTLHLRLPLVDSLNNITLSDSLAIEPVDTLKGRVFTPKR